MNALSLFSGIGGIDLACEWAGIKTVAFCEREPFCKKVLRKHWPHAPIYDDVCTLTREVLERDGIGTIDLIHGGYPCQPFSYAGKRRGAEDDRHLWPEVARLLSEIRPRWFVGENVAGHVTLGLDDVLSDLESLDYTAQAFVIPACAVGAPHRRDRVFVVAHANSERREEHFTATICEKLGQRTWRDFEKVLSNADTNSKSRLQADSSVSTFGGERGTWNDVGGLDWKPLPGTYWDVFEPPFFGVAHGLPDQVDRVTALGNAVVPQQVYPILAAIKLIDDWMRGETS
jgi:DNA (cytosine-5)-methyltransferase 1